MGHVYRLHAAPAPSEARTAPSRSTAGTGQGATKATGHVELVAAFLDSADVDTPSLVAAFFDTACLRAAGLDPVAALG